ncbi:MULTISPECIES: FAD-binding oxidoreductase [Prochlorococcus]|uniref:FAD/FMN-containing dehydrogenase n=1 Tax=Prochlorococcus marinus (strain SARG / CCMP1375 / SS120) TaxID=167539 RepID=Q7VAS7_PROMA|nr:MULTISPECIES: FAD-binding oxidoreductase [Prochlorococcus]AAQ00421.1 FAD/FMN-containing dehydrogenase [Prochlorococcus marinus subsp. marinus str. CCMP1375]KGG14304.1 FAD/FMN-containing dehydrogenase [Prochlorococcus marinus str. LG]KGG22124.1 FAD/FMN-containing dehydrogenase [Prochlorococcus marinus str. SS2]KGG24559.1 FAD/FMN-containing dehydrogenase [Prochlorococcus marinus str. SS35]KGG33453.1 FAD/FMN-containing dehydrogenase [Prochlorococcus marinus str. SS51]
MLERSDFNQFVNEIKNIPNLEVLLRSAEHKRYSRDFYEYSPVLKEELAGCCADLVVRPLSVDAVISVAQICQAFQIPLTLRGAGTGNYGQCVPLQGGVVMLMTSLTQIRNFDSQTGEVTVEAGCLLIDLNRFLISKGRQLRLLPSTWRTASVAGFIAGGSGGIGSVRWGFLRDPGHLLGLEIVTLEESPRKIQLNAKPAEALNHAYGTNGIITSLKLSTCPNVDWQEVTIDCADFYEAVKLFKTCNQVAVNLFLCSLLENKIVESLPTWSGNPAGKHRLLLLVEPDGISTLERLSKSVGADFYHLGSEQEKVGNGLRELTWNHTTMHMRGVNSDWTYLQMLLPQPEIDLINTLSRKWGQNILWHLEAVRQQGDQRIAALPLVRWQGKDNLEQLINECKELGAIIFNPHVITVEDGGLGVIDSEQVKAKREYDPKGILNPGKLKGWI